MNKICHTHQRPPKGVAHGCHAPSTNGALSIILPLFCLLKPRSKVTPAENYEIHCWMSMCSPCAAAFVARWQLGLHRWTRRRPLYAVMVLFLSGKLGLESRRKRRFVRHLGGHRWLYEATWKHKKGWDGGLVLASLQLWLQPKLVEARVRAEETEKAKQRRVWLRGQREQGRPEE